MIGYAEQLRTTVRTTVSYNLGLVENIPLGEGREYKVAGELIAIFRERNGALHAVQALCPHRGGALADGLVGAGKVVCPMHAFKYELSTGNPVGHDCAALKTYRVRINSLGEILLSL
ncbi:MAG: Rieske 2Fe-2S domain-containing protein [Acidobacteriota bacterium]